MKKLLLCLTILFSLTSAAHKINGYKFVHVNETGNLYGVEDRLSQYLSGIGFTLVPSYEIEDMSNEDKALLLFVDYTWNIVYGGHSVLIVSFTDVSNTVIYKTSGQGISFSAAGDMKNALKKVFKKIDELHYAFDPNLIKVKSTGDVEFSTWSEEKIKEHLSHTNLSSLEGIYKNYSNSLDYYQIAILKKDKTYYGIVMETSNERWEKGDVKIMLNYVDKGIYDVSYYNFKGKKLNSLAEYKGRLLTFNADLGNNGVAKWEFLKIYPSGNETNSLVEDEMSAVESTIKGSASGFVISGNIVATNFHVVDGAGRVTVTLMVDGIAEEYNAKVLCVDKTNDLALISIKDEHFKPMKPAPYKIATNSVDVGTSVFTMGYPMSNVLGEEVKITDGLISSKTGYSGDAVTYQISAPIQPGNSGGAMFDKDGNLVGITNAGVASADNVGYAIKTNYLLNLIDSAPISIELPRGENLKGNTLPELIKAYKPYVAFIKIYE